MELHRVSSSSINSIGYNSLTLTVGVKFITGALYEYYQVPESVYNMFNNASSKGTYLANHIEDKFKYRKVLVFTS